MSAPARGESAPLVTTGTASEIGITNASLSGTVSSSAPLTGCWFEWGIPPRLESSVPCQVGVGGDRFVTAQAEANGLRLGTSYSWRLAAGNESGIAHGAVSSFTTTGFPLEEGEAAGERLVESLPKRAPAPAHGSSRPGVDKGLYVAYCAYEDEAGAELASHPRAAAAMANHTGWPGLECLKMDKAGHGLGHVLIGLAHVHNYLLGGYGNDTAWAGDDGDVIWGDYHPSGQSTRERDNLHGGAGTDWIYSSHGHNEIWTGAGEDHVALVYGFGEVHCNGPGLKTLVMRLLPRNRHWRLVGCRDRKVVPYRA